MLRNILLILIAFTFSLPVAWAGSTQVPVMMRAQDDLDTCALGKVVGLNPNGDNFLAVRSGPGTDYNILDKIHTNDEVWLFDYKDGWIGIVYGTRSVNCSPIKSDKPYSGPGKRGWVWEKYVTVIAG